MIIMNKNAGVQSETLPDNSLDSAWVVTTNRLIAHGIRKADKLVIDRQNWQQNGAWLILEFDHKYYIRELTILSQSLHLAPLAGSQQSLEWPLFSPLPVVGRIVRIERAIAAL